MAGIAADFPALSDRLAGSFVLAGDEGWDLARQCWNLAVDQQPAAVALPESAEDVRAVVEFAWARGLGVAPQGTGHGALASLEAGFAVYTFGMARTPRWAPPLSAISTWSWRR